MGGDREAVTQSSRESYQITGIGDVGPRCDARRALAAAFHRGGIEYIEDGAGHAEW
ncbi:hypothetical protein OG317_00380 [Streptomyces sp. NBC_01167]|uniref:hypothetical protein n=1 Tax=Streptomyces sp. NBC_01167 TaxID=2903756 RepID=UPI00386AB6EE|nr:hypothetical protein OG317_00380 [Streptomyces sp. NBC_01167]